MQKSNKKYHKNSPPSFYPHYLLYIFILICQTPAFYASHSSLLKDAFGARRSFIYFFNLLPERASKSRIREAGWRANCSLQSNRRPSLRDKKHKTPLSLFAATPHRKREREKSAIDWQRAGSFGRARTQRDGVTVENFENFVCVNLSRTAEEYVKLGDYNIQLGLEKHSDSLTRSILLGEKSGDVKEQPRK